MAIIFILTVIVVYFMCTGKGDICERKEEHVDSDMDLYSQELEALDD